MSPSLPSAPISLGAWRILEQFGVRADAAAGHSYGELTALCAAGRLKPDAFFRLSRLRGRLMADVAGESGAMLAVQATQETIAEVLRGENLDLVLANKNAPQQTVLSGPTTAIERAAAAFTARQIRAQRLTVSAAFHSPLVAAAAEPFRAALEEIDSTPERCPSSPTARPSRIPTSWLPPAICSPDSWRGRSSLSARSNVSTNPASAPSSKSVPAIA